MANKTRRFVVETHSDYLLDRIRMEVRSGKHIRAGDVSILYFERGKDGAHIHNIELDSAGSIVNPPPGYRQFFVIALFFAVLHLGVIMVGSSDLSSVTVIYLLGLILALIALILG